MASVLLFDPLDEFLIGKKEFSPLGVLYISAWLKAHGHEVRVIHGEPEEIPAGYSTYGISATTPQYPAARRALDRIRELAPKARVVLGGPHANAPRCAAEALTDGFDQVVVGEGETAMLDIVEGRAAEPVIKGEPLKNIDDLFPDRDAIDFLNYGYPLDSGVRAATIMTARGCPYKCQFCSSAEGTARWRSIERVEEEVDLLVNRYGYKGLLFVDDVFTLKPTRLHEMLRMLKKYGVVWRCYARTDLKYDELSAMKEAGCVEVGAGVESGSQRVLDLVMKLTTTVGNKEFIRNCKRAGILANTFIMVGLPGESPQTILETRRWMEEAVPERFGYNIYTPYPDSPIVQKFDHFKNYITIYPMPYEKALTKAKKITECFISTPWLTREEIIAAYYENFEHFTSVTGFDPRRRGFRAIEYMSSST